MSQYKWNEEAEKQWNERSSGWNSKSMEMWNAGSRKDIAPFFAKYVKANRTVCDLGCGDGVGSLKLTELGYSVVGIDVSEEMTDKAKQLNSGNTAQFLKGDISSLPFENDSFDAILAINSLEWTEHPLHVMKEIQRIVKPGGNACIGI